MTIENRQVVKGIFYYYGTLLGLPLCSIIDFLWENESVVDWLDFYIDARKSGMKHDNVIKLIRCGFQDSIYCNDVEINLDNFCKLIVDGRHGVAKLS